jgi:hypothetical protein
MDSMIFRLIALAVRALAAAGALAWVVPALGADAPAPPQLPSAQQPAPAASNAPRRVIRAPEPAPEPAAPAARPAASAQGVVQWHGEPSADEQLPPAGGASNETRIEQKRQANRIVEVIVTPAGSTHSYVMHNQEGQRPRTFQDIGGTGLSLPQFLRIPVK